MTRPSLQTRIEQIVQPLAGRSALHEYPTVRELARRLRVTQMAVSDAVEDSELLDLIVGIRVNGAAGGFARVGDYRVEWVGEIDTPSDVPTDKEAPRRRKPPAITEVRPAGENHQVVTLEGGQGGYRRRPCSDCPWRVDATGEFPAAAFKHSAGTAYDMATHTFACHQSGQQKPATCAGFLLRGADHNLAVRLGRARGRFEDDVSEGGVELHASYRAMAVANGVDPDDPVLTPCRDPGY